MKNSQASEFLSCRKHQYSEGYGQWHPTTLISKVLPKYFRGFQIFFRKIINLKCCCCCFSINNKGLLAFFKFFYHDNVIKFKTTLDIMSHESEYLSRYVNPSFSWVNIQTLIKMENSKLLYFSIVKLVLTFTILVIWTFNKNILRMFVLISILLDPMR